MAKAQTVTFRAAPGTRLSWYEGPDAREHIIMFNQARYDFDVNDPMVDAIDALFCVSGAHPVTSQPEEPPK